VQFWDLFGEQGHPIRTTVSEMGPLLLSRLMNLNEVQEGVLNIAFNVADKEQLLLLDLDDLQSMLVHCGEEADQLTLQYGNVSKQSVGSIQRSLLQLRSQGGDHFFGEPALDLKDLMAKDDQARGIVNILAADKLMASPRLYATFLLWLLSELFEVLPEIGDPDRPVLCFFFDEAHLLFDDAPPGLLEKVEQVVRLIRSKGVGVYFITQNPIDIPDKVAAQLNNRIQHKLNAFTPRDQQAVKAAADTFRVNPAIDVERAITELKIGEALVSLLQPDGSPEPVQRSLIRPPSTRVGPLTEQERQVIVTTDAIGSKYDTLVDRQSAEELLVAKAAEASAAAAAAKAQSESEKQAAEQARVAAQQAKADARAQLEQQRLDLQRQRMEQQEAARQAREAAKPTLTDKVLQSAVRAASSSVGRQLGNSLLRGILGGLMRGR
jgi:DNA helicase HerA-like ATPase